MRGVQHKRRDLLRHQHKRPTNNRTELIQLLQPSLKWYKKNIWRDLQKLWGFLVAKQSWLMINYFLHFLVQLGN